MLSWLAKGFWGDTFHTRIKIRVVHHLTNDIIDEREVEQLDIPESLAQPLKMIIEGTTWNVINVDPVSPYEYTLSKRLTIRVLQQEEIEASVQKRIDPATRRNYSFTAITPIPPGK